MWPASLLHELTREQASTLAPTALTVFPVGATEQHGPHLPMGTDTFTVEYIAHTAAGVAAATIPLVVTPTLPFGSSHHHLPFGGAMSLSTETYYRTVFELAESLVTGGFRRLSIINGHGGNTELIHLVARGLALKHAVHLAAGPYWTIAWEDLVAATTDMPGRLPGHAGIYETSQILALRPELVREDRPRHDLSGPPPRCDILGPFFYEGYVLTEPLPIRGGEARPLEKPGLGVEFDDDKLAIYRSRR